MRHDSSVQLFNMAPMHNELEAIRTGSGSPWSAEFGSHKNMAMANSLSNGPEQVSNSSSRVSGAGPMSNAPMRYQPRFMGGNSMLFSRNMAMNRAAPQEPQINWDDQFANVEKEISESVEVEAPEVVETVENNEDNVEMIDDINEEFEKIWQKMQPSDISLNIFDNEMANQEYDPSSFKVFDEYKFEQASNNAYLKLPDPYEIGLELMEKGAKLSEAALAFEAAVQQNPKHLLAWLKLGEIQSANEKERAGLAANMQALKLDPGNLQALLNLAIGFINEGYDSSALQNLKEWLFIKYPQSKSFYENTPKEPEPDNGVLGFYNAGFERLVKTFLQVIRTDSNALKDPELQLGLGVLFYSRGEFKKTADCFKTALKVQPNNEVIWNRLGAALANDNRSEEAIEAYYKALQLKPSFVRARYNLGILCINIGCYKDAAEHFLAGLSLHKVDNGEDYKDGEMFDIPKNQSDHLLDSLKRAFISMDRRDLAEKVQANMDLNQFRGEFNF